MNFRPLTKVSVFVITDVIKGAAVDIESIKTEVRGMEEAFLFVLRNIDGDFEMTAVLICFEADPTKSISDEDFTCSKLRGFSVLV